MAEPAPAFSNNEFFSAAYEELLRVARSKYGSQAGLTWNPTAVVNEVYLRMAESKGFQPKSEQHLKHTVIRAMRFVLVEAARKRAAERRGGGDFPVRHVPIDENAMQSSAYDPNEVLSVDFALAELAKHSEFQAQVFEYQFFGGLQVAEIAEILGVSEKKVQRGLRLAKAFLTISLRDGRTG
jgi:RNA polymerase sigma factor (TIGR02999 family)